MHKHKIILADDHQLVKLGLSQIIKANPKFEIVGEASNGKEALDLVFKTEAELLILDIEMPLMNGLEVLKKIKEKKLPIKILLVTLFKERDLLKTALELQADGYLIKDNAVDELITAINTILSGEKYFSKEVMTNLIDTKSKISSEYEINNLISCLTKTEKQILKLISKNKATKEIAIELFIAEKTVKVHRYNISKKIHLEHDQSGLLKFAIENKDFL